MAFSLFLAFVILLKLVTFSTSEETCEKIDTCSCKLKNGSTVSLKPVDGSGSNPRFTGIQGAASRTFDWNPCTPFSIPTPPGCKNAMVCQVSFSVAYIAGTKDSTFSVDSEGNVVILYGGFKDTKGHTRQTKITLKCDQSTNGTKPASFTETKPSSQSSVYIGTFTSKYACAKGGSSGGLSVGSILLIIFFPLVVVYVIIGILINRYGRGIESMPELLPNHSFWADFPFLVKDGAVFTCGCIKSACSSLSNKCGKSGYAEI